MYSDIIGFGLLLNVLKVFFRFILETVAETLDDYWETLHVNQPPGIVPDVLM